MGGRREKNAKCFIKNFSGIKRELSPSSFPSFVLFSFCFVLPFDYKALSSLNGEDRSAE